VTFSSHRGDKSGIYRVPADASRQPELLVTVASSVFPFSWTPDGKTLLYMQHVGEKSQILMLTPPANGGESKPRLFLESAFGGLDPKVSPDGKWVAYADSNEGAANGEVFVVPLAGPGGKFQISTQGGTRPAWSHDGRELYYEERATLRVMAADIRTGPPFVAGRPQPLFKLSGLGAEWEPAPDGKRFLVERIPERTTTFVVVTNWFADLKK
jgi:Tol biopolymer transport system component